MLRHARGYVMNDWLVSRTALEVSKRVGTPMLVNQLFKIYFKVCLFLFLFFLVLFKAYLRDMETSEASFLQHDMLLFTIDI